MKSALLEEIQNESTTDLKVQVITNLKKATRSLQLILLWVVVKWTNGRSRKEFDEGLEQFTADGIDMDAEVQKLTTATHVLKRRLYGFKTYSEKFMPVLERIGESAEGVELVEFLMEMTSQQSMSGDAPTTTLTKAELEEKMRDPRYWNPTQRDNNFVKEVTEGFAKISR